jgi:hypothetical protein
MLSNVQERLFRFQRAGDYFLLGVTEHQTVCGTLSHVDRIPDCIDVRTQLPNGCALSVSRRMTPH